MTSVGFATNSISQKDAKPTAGGLSVALVRKILGVGPVAKVNQRVMINRATFYAHYGTPYDLLTEIEHEMIDEIMCEIERLWQKRGSLDFRVSTEIMCQYFYNHADMICVLMRNFSGQDFARMLNQIYQAILDSSVIQDADKDNIKLMTAYLAGGGVFLLSTWLKEDIKKGPQEIAQLITGLFSENIFLKQTSAGSQT